MHTLLFYNVVCICIFLIDLLDGGATSWVSSWSTTISSREASTHGRAWSTARGSVHLLDDWVAHALELLLHGLELLLLSMLSSVQPAHDLVDLVLDGLLVILTNGILELLVIDLVLHVVSIALEAILGINALLRTSILLSELLSLTDHTLDVVLGETALVIGDGDVSLLARGGLVLSSHIEHTVGIHIKGDLDLWDSTWCWWDSSELELAEQVVVLGA